MSKQSRDDVLTLLAVGASAAVIASLAHEALGHGLGCAIDRGSITLCSRQRLGERAETTANGQADSIPSFAK